MDILPLDVVIHPLGVVVLEALGHQHVHSLVDDVVVLPAVYLAELVVELHYTLLTAYDERGYLRYDNLLGIGVGLLVDYSLLEYLVEQLQLPVIVELGAQELIHSLELVYLLGEFGQQVHGLLAYPFHLHLQPEDLHV